jgi:AraC family transcriptional regulator, transcriptional activator of pobA
MRPIPIRKINLAGKEPNFSGSFSIRSITDLLSGKDMLQELHRHDFFFMLALEKGNGMHEIDFTSYKIKDRSIFFMRPGQVHQLNLKEGSIGYLMAFKGDFFNRHNAISNQLLRDASSKNYSVPAIRIFKKIYAVLTCIFYEYTQKQARYWDAINANLAILFIELARNTDGNPSRSSNNNYAQKRLDELFELLETHISTHKKVADYADLLNLSTYQLNSITKKTVAKTCSQLIDEFIILESKRYLLATTSQVNQIAYYLGYDDVSYFIRFFKKHTGSTPDSFRNNFK